VAVMLGELKAFPVLQGARGQKPVDVDALAEVIERIGDIAVGLGEGLQELEINPLWVGDESIEALDALIRWS
jgi:succinyl-CoA synthetase beta subunit